MAIHLVLGAAFLTGLALQPERRTEDGLKTFDVVPQPPSPPIEPALRPAPTADPAPSGKKADPSPIVAPPARLPTVQPVAAAPVAGSGSLSNSGAAAGRTGTGSGTDSGGDSGGRTIGTEARLLSGNRGRVPRELLRSFASDNGFAHLLLTIGATGNVTACSVIQGTGSGAVDQALCQIMMQQSRWSPALDMWGRPISVRLPYTSIWRK